MRCPLCRSEISMSAQVCPHCCSDLGDYYAEHGPDTSGLEPITYFLVKWFFHTFMLFIPFALFVGFVIEPDSGTWGWWSFGACAAIAVVYRDKLPIF